MLCVFPTDFREGKVKLEMKGSFSKEEQKTALIDGQNMSSEVFWRFKKGQILFWIFKIRTQLYNTNLQAGSSSFLFADKGHALDKSQISHSQKSQQRNAVENCTFSNNTEQNWHLANQGEDFQCQLKHSAFLGKEYHLCWHFDVKNLKLKMFFLILLYS